MKGDGIYLTIKDLAKLTGQDYNSACRSHLAIRDAIAKNKKHLTIKEYCAYTKDNFEEIWEYLRGKKP